MRIYYTAGEDGIDIITKADSELYNISEKELYKIAIDKLVKTCNIKIKLVETKGKIEHAFSFVRDKSKRSIQSNCVWLICPGILSDFAEQWKSNLYILPVNYSAIQWPSSSRLTGEKRNAWFLRNQTLYADVNHL